MAPSWGTWRERGGGNRLNGAMGQARGRWQSAVRGWVRMRGPPAHASRARPPPSPFTSCLRSMVRIWSSVVIVGDRPPWTQNIWLSMMALRLRGGFRGEAWGVLSQTQPRDGGSDTQPRAAAVQGAGRRGRSTTAPEVVKHIGAVAPHVDRAVLAQALVIKAVHLGDLAGLVVAADQGDAVGVAHLAGGRAGSRARVSLHLHRLNERGGCNPGCSCARMHKGIL